MIIYTVGILVTLFFNLWVLKISNCMYELETWYLTNYSKLTNESFDCMIFSYKGNKPCGRKLFNICWLIHNIFSCERNELGLDVPLMGD